MGEREAEKQARFQAALDAFVGRLEQDRYIVAAVLDGSIDEALMWCKDSIHLWIIEADGVTKRRKSDGEDTRLFRTLIENDVNFHAEIIPRLKFRRMVEGKSRTAFTHNFFSKRTLVYAADASTERWFAEANSVATKDQRTEIFVISTWLCHALKYVRRLLDDKEDVAMARRELGWVAWALAARAIVEHGSIHEGRVIYRGLELAPDLLDIVYTQVLESPGEDSARAALERAESFLETNADADFAPLLRHLKKQGRYVPLSELGDHFAYTQLYPWHLEAACEWMVEQERLDKLSAAYHLTKKSSTEFEEPAYAMPGVG